MLENNFSNSDNWLLQFLTNQNKKISTLDKYDLLKNSIETDIVELLKKSEVISIDSDFGIYAKLISFDGYKAKIELTDLGSIYGKHSTKPINIKYKNAIERLIIKLTRVTISLVNIILRLINKSATFSVKIANTMYKGMKILFWFVAGIWATIKVVEWFISKGLIK